MEDWRDLGARLSNWGRWGQDDERGTLNLIDPDLVVTAAALVTAGAVTSLAIPVDQYGPQVGTRSASGRVNPIHLMTTTGVGQPFEGGFQYADDMVILPLQSGTQWDALSHVYYDDVLYNGFPSSTLTVGGAGRNAVTAFEDSIVGRGVLLDIADLLGVEWLAAGQPVTPEHLDAAAALRGVSVGRGDVVLVRTGWRAKFLADGDAESFMGAEPGLTLSCAEWLCAREVAAVASDNWGVEVITPAGTRPAPGADQSAMSLHLVLIRDVGMPLGELFDLERLAVRCRELDRHDFFLSAAPLPVSGAVGAPVVPLAIH